MELVDLTDAVRGVDFRVFAEPIAAGGRCAGSWPPGCGGYVAPGAGRADRPRAAPRRRWAGPPVGRGRRLADRPGGQVPWRICWRVRGALGAAGDLILIVADADAIRGAEALGHVRLEMGDRLSCGPRASWPTHGSATSRCSSGTRRQALGCHNPFSAPVWEEEDRLESDPGSIRAQQYDLVLNGWEAGGGSIRIHRRDLLERAFALMGHSMESARDQFGPCSTRSSTGRRLTAGSPSGWTDGQRCTRRWTTSAR